jgi:hypothetical protein
MASKALEKLWSTCKICKGELYGLTPFSTHNYVKPVGEMILGYILI